MTDIGLSAAAGRAIKVTAATTAAMQLALEVSVVNDSQDDDSDYDFGHDLARFHRRRPILEKELAKQQARHNMMATTTTTITSSFSDTGPAPQMHQIDVESIASASDSSLTDLEEDDDDDGLPGFNIGRTNTTLGLRHATPSKYSMQDILKLARKNKSNEAVIERAQRLYDENAEEKLPEAPLTRMENLVPYLDPQNRNDTFVKSWMDRNATPDYDWSFFEQEIPPLRVTRPHFSKHYANPLLSQLQGLCSSFHTSRPLFFGPLISSPHRLEHVSPIVYFWLYRRQSKTWPV